MKKFLIQKLIKKEIEVKHPIQRDLIKPGLNVYVTNYNSDGIVSQTFLKMIKYKFK